MPNSLWPHGHQTPLSSTISQNLLKFMSIESVMLSKHLILCCLLLLPSIFPSIHLFQWVRSLHQVAKILELQKQFFQCIQSQFLIFRSLMLSYMSLDLLLIPSRMVGFFLFFNFTILYWFCHISTWIRHRYTRVPHPEPSSLLPPHTIPLGHPSALAPSIQYHSTFILIRSENQF